MRILHRGHTYALDHVDGPGTTTVQFVNKEPGTEQEGVTTQEILRMLIDRTRYCNNCMPHRVNEEIIYHFRKALALHEGRALERAVDKGFPIETAVIQGNGHLALQSRPPLDKETILLDEVVEYSHPEQKASYEL